MMNAETELRVTLRGVEADSLPSRGGRPTLEVYVLVIDQFIQHLEYRNLSPNTLRRRRETVRQLARFIQPLPVEAATLDHLEEFLGTKTAARTRHAYRSDLRVFYAWAQKHGLIVDNPAIELDKIKVPKGLPRPLDSDAARGALTVGSLKRRRMIGLALFAGFRCHEIAGLHAEDVWTHVQPPVIIVRNGKGGKDRKIKMHPELVDLLRDIPSSGPVFPGRGRPTMTAGTVSRGIVTHLRDCGIDGTAHQLRHTFGTEFARRSGGDMMRTAAMMGHESMNTTAGYVQLGYSGEESIIDSMYGDDAA